MVVQGSPPRAGGAVPPQRPEAPVFAVGPIPAAPPYVPYYAGPPGDSSGAAGSGWGPTSPLGSPRIVAAAEEGGWSGGPMVGGGAMVSPYDDPDRAGERSQPKFCGRRIVAGRRVGEIGTVAGLASPMGADSGSNPAGLNSVLPPSTTGYLQSKGSAAGATEVFFAVGMGLAASPTGKPPEKRPARRTGVTAKYTLPNDYGDEGWVRSSEAYGAGLAAPPRVEGPPVGHDVDMHRREAEEQGAAWHPPQGWCEEQGGDWRGEWLPPDPGVLFGAELPGGSGNPFGRHPARPGHEWPPPAPAGAIDAAPQSPPRREGAVYPYPAGGGGGGGHSGGGGGGRGGRGDGTVATDLSGYTGRWPRRSGAHVPLRPPCCSGAPTPARHAFREDEQCGPTAVVQLDRPAMLPRGPPPALAPAPIPPKPQAIFGKYGGEGDAAAQHHGRIGPRPSVRAASAEPPWATHDGYGHGEADPRRTRQL